MEGDREPVIRPGEEFLAARVVLELAIGDPAGYAASDLLHRVIDAVEAVRYAGEKRRPITDNPQA